MVKITIAWFHHIENEPDLPQLLMVHMVPCPWYRASWQVGCLWGEITRAAEKKGGIPSYNVFNAFERKFLCCFCGWKPAFVGLSTMAQMQAASFQALVADSREGTSLQLMRSGNGGRQRQSSLGWVKYNETANFSPSLLVLWIFPVSLQPWQKGRRASGLEWEQGTKYKKWS